MLPPNWLRKARLLFIGDRTLHEFYELISEAKTLLSAVVKNSLKQSRTFQLILTFIIFFSFHDRRLPEYKQRIAGKSIPFEKFSIHKANKYLAQNHRLFLPGMVSA